MQTEFGLIQHHQGRKFRLQEERRKTDETQSSVGHLMGSECRIAADLTPSQPNTILILRFEHEVTEERRDLSNNPGGLSVGRTQRRIVASRRRSNTDARFAASGRNDRLSATEVKCFTGARALVSWK